MWRFETDRRGYEMSIELDLFGGFWLLRRWWGLHNRRGSGKREQFWDLGQTWSHAQRIVHRRLRHGYAILCKPSLALKEIVIEELRRPSPCVVSSSALSRLPKKKAVQVSAAETKEKEEAQLSLL